MMASPSPSPSPNPGCFCPDEARVQQLLGQGVVDAGTVIADVDVRLCLGGGEGHFSPTLSPLTGVVQKLCLLGLLDLNTQRIVNRL